jgi:NTP pyrophosphatase (non-canonical NTP hydrolase)
MKMKYALLVLAEELGELQKEVFKAIRFGLDDVNPDTNIKNIEAIKKEYADVMGSIKYLKKLGIPKDTFKADKRLVKSKVAKIQRFYTYSKVMGGWDTDCEEVDSSQY